MQHEKNTTPKYKACSLYGRVMVVEVRLGCCYRMKCNIWFLWTAGWVFMSLPFCYNNYINAPFSKALGGAQCSTALFVLSGSQLWINLNKPFLLLQEPLLSALSVMFSVRMSEYNENKHHNYYKHTVPFNAFQELDYDPFYSSPLLL